ncbi:MAG: tripartite tricarboxylate transporter substrate binding protein [Dehalobacterium sp.]
MRKRILFLMVGILLILSLAFVQGCGSSDSGDGNQEQNQEGTQGQEKVEKPGDYPNRTVNIIIPYGPGGGSDSFVRMMGKIANEIEGFPSVCVNVPGAGSITGLTQLTTSDPDGYTIASLTSDYITCDVFDTTELTVDDFKWVIRGCINASMIFANSKSEKFKTWDDVIAEAKARPGEITVGITSIGDEVVLAALRQHGVDLKGVMTQTPAERFSSLVGGHLDLILEQPGDGVSFLEAGQIKALLSLTDERLTGFEDAPSSMELGYEVTYPYWRGIVAHKDTPDEIVNYLHDVFKKVIETDEFKQYLHEKYMDSQDAYLGKDDFYQASKEEVELYENIAKEVGMK